MITIDRLINENTNSIDINFINKMIINFQNMTSQLHQYSDVEHLRNLFKQYLNRSEKSITSSEDFENVLNFIKRASDHFISTGTLKPIITQENGHEVKRNPIDNNQLGWFTFQSSQLTGINGYSKGEISHRFYITSNGRNIAQFSEALLKEFEKRKLPFYFKININHLQGPKDFLVIYASTNELENTLSVINTVAMNNQDLINLMNAPHELTNSIDSWIGYAQENKQLQGEESYTGLLSDEIAKTLVSSVQEWVDMHQAISINSDGIKPITTKDLVDKAKLNDIGKEFSKAKRDKISYYQGVSYMLSVIPRVDSNFLNDIVKKLRISLEEKQINPDNIALNIDVMKEVSHLISHYSLTHNISQEVDSAQTRNEYMMNNASSSTLIQDASNILREEIMDENLSKSADEGLAQLRNEMMNENISKPIAEELGKLREEYIKMMSGEDSDFEVVSDKDSTYSDHMTLPSQSNGMHRR